MKKILTLLGLILTAFPIIAQDHFTVAYTSQPPAYMSVYVFQANLGGETLKSGDEIAVYDGGICCGVYKLTSDFSSVIAIPAAKAETSGTGYTIGHSISVKIWDSSEQKEYNANVEFRSNSPYQVFTDNESAYINISVIFEVTVQLTAENKVYDGTVNATVGYQITSGSVSGDVTITASGGTFNNKNVGTGKTVTGEISVTGTDAGKFDFTLNESATASITSKSVTVSGAAANNKTYDGTKDATISGATLSGVISGDNVTIGSSTGQFSQKEVGTNIPVTAALTLSGTAASNYTLVQPTGLYANITTRTITVKANTITKECSGDDPALTYTYSPSLGTGDSFSGKLSREPGESIGEYDILQGTLSLNSNYNLVFNGALFKIEDKSPEWVTALHDLDREVSYLDATGLENAQNLFPVATDGCDPDVTDLDKVSGSFVAGTSCSLLGTYTNKWTVTDNSGNKSAEYVQVITLVDTIDPVFEPVQDVEMIVAPGICETKIDYPELVANDGCLDEIYLLSGKGVAGLFPVGTTKETWVAVDKSGNSDTISFNVSVISENENPVINDLKDIIVNNDTQNIDLVLSGIYGNGCSVQHLYVSVEASNKELVQLVNVIYCDNNSKGILEIQLINEAVGSSVITVTVEDDQERKTSKSFTLTVREENNAPYVVTPVEDLSVNASYTLNLSLSSVLGEYFDDPDNDTLTISAYEEGKCGLPDWISFKNDSLFAEPLLADTGCVNIVVLASDAFGGMASDTFAICVDGYPVGTKTVKSGQINIYPNPTNGNVTLDFGKIISEAKLSVLDANGKVVKNEQHVLTNKVVVNMSGLVSGMYFIKTQLDGQNITSKVLLKK